MNHRCALCKNDRADGKVVCDDHADQNDTILGQYYGYLAQKLEEDEIRTAAVSAAEEAIRRVRAAKPRGRQ